MNIREELMREHSKKQRDKICDFIGNDKKKFNELMSLFLEKDYRLTQRSAWVVGVVLEKNAVWLNDFMPSFFIKLKEKPLHDAVKRNIVRLWDCLSIPEEFEGQVFDLCFSYLESNETSVAIKAYSMNICSKLAKKYPDLRGEVDWIIKENVKKLGKTSPAIRSRAKHTITEN